jgi:hypothetical protein
MAFLYIGPKGLPWRKHSYSAGNDYDQSPYKYYLRRILGWRERENKARYLFGRALEESIQFHHDHDGQGAIEDFIRRWNEHKDRTDLVYTKVEKDWDTLLLDGIDMIKLYTIKQPSLPIPLGGRTVFQREYKKEVFPGDSNYGEIEDAGKLDIVSYADPDHPLLSPLAWRPEYGMFRPVIIDIKTSGTDFPQQPGIAGFDKQLRRYSWLCGIRDVALLGFKKTGRTLKKGNSVTLLGDATKGGQTEPFFKAGDEAVIAQVEGDLCWLIKNDFELELLDQAGDNTKVGKEKKQTWLKENAIPVPSSIITRQRLQFLSGYVTLESAAEAGAEAGRQIVQIVNSWKNKSWINTFGIRYPHDDRNDPYFRAFVLEDEAYRKEHFLKTNEESFDDLDIEDSGEEE